MLEGIVGYVPPRVVANAGLPSAWGVDDAWMHRRTGIRERRRADPGVSTGELALEAGRRALAVAGGAPVDTVLVATSTPDRPMPAMAPQLATRLGLGGAADWDVNAACSGFPYGLATAAGALLSGCADRVLLVAADLYSPLLDPEDHSAGIVFGDGAGAVALRRRRSGEPGSVLAFDLARVELQIMLETVLRKLPGLRLAAVPEDRLVFQRDTLVYGLRELRVAW